MTPTGAATLDTYHFQLESADDTAANFYLHPPEVGHEETFDTYRDGDLSIIEAGYGDGTTVTTGFEILVHADMDGSEPPSVRADYEITLSGNSFRSDTYIATDQTTIDFETSD
jgi:alanine racemase